MLAITRNFGEGFWIGDIYVCILSARGRCQVRVAIDAPKDVRILREEIANRPPPPFREDDGSGTEKLSGPIPGNLIPREE